MILNELQQGYWSLLQKIYAPQAFFDRSFKVYRNPDFRRRGQEEFAPFPKEFGS